MRAVAYNLPFACPISHKLHCVVVAVVQVQHKGRKFQNGNVAFAVVYQFAISYHHVAVVKNRVVQIQIEIVDAVGKLHFQRFAVPWKGHFRKGEMLQNFVPVVTKICQTASVWQQHFHRRTAVVAQLRTGIFQQHGIEIVVGHCCPVKVDGCTQKCSLRQVQNVLLCWDCLSKIQMTQKTVYVGKKDVTDVAALQMKHSFFGVVVYHNFSLQYIFKYIVAVFCLFVHTQKKFSCDLCANTLVLLSIRFYN